jgi:hypothetical protein
MTEHLNPWRFAFFLNTSTRSVYKQWKKQTPSAARKCHSAHHLMLCGTNGQLILVEWSEGATGLDQWLGVGPDHSTQRRGID